ncbi:hypothetical protein PENTCL1PPCAC_5263, partial [Pristionchus entomophagus]
LTTHQLLKQLSLAGRRADARVVVLLLDGVNLLDRMRRQVLRQIGEPLARAHRAHRSKHVPVLADALAEEEPGRGSKIGQTQ